jgi:serine phosphatase RsbU (regulator of sigma subunit)
VDAANAALHSQFPDGSFVTSLLVRLDLERRNSSVVNAGHHPPMRVRNGEVEQLLPRPRLPLGPFDDATYRSEPLDFGPGDRLVLFSDGVTEVAPDGGEPWGLLGFAEFLQNTRHLHANEVVRQAMRAVLDFRRGDLRDDATVVCVDWVL